MARRQPCLEDDISKIETEADTVIRTKQLSERCLVRVIENFDNRTPPFAILGVAIEYTVIVDEVNDRRSPRFESCRYFRHLCND